MTCGRDDVAPKGGRFLPTKWMCDDPDVLKVVAAKTSRRDPRGRIHFPQRSNVFWGCVGMSALGSLFLNLHLQRGSYAEWDHIMSPHCTFIVALLLCGFSPERCCCQGRKIFCMSPVIRKTSGRAKNF